jgi:ribosomal protein S11
LHGVAPVRLGLPRVKNLYVLFRRRLHTRYRKLVVKFNQRNFFARVFGRKKRRLRRVLRFWNIPEKLRKKHSLFFFFLKHRKEAAKKRVRLGRQFVLSLRKAQQLLLAKKKRKGLHFFRTASFVLVKRTVNNFFLTAYDAAGATLTSFSSGAAGWQGSKRVNLQSTEAVGKQLMHKLKKRNLDFSRVVVVLRTRLDRLARAAIKGLVDNGMQISLFSICG